MRFDQQRADRGSEPAGRHDAQRYRRSAREIAAPDPRSGHRLVGPPFQYQPSGLAAGVRIDDAIGEILKGLSVRGSIISIYRGAPRPRQRQPRRARRAEPRHDCSAS